MKKKLTCAILAAAMLAFAGCSSDNAPSSEVTPSQGDSQVENQSETSDENPDKQEEASETPSSTNQEASQEPSSASNDEITVEEQVVYEENGIKITVKNIDLDGSFYGPELDFLIENDSEKNFTVQARNVSINGYMVDYNMSADVAPQKKNNDSLTFFKSSLDQCGIKQIAEIEFSLHIFNSDNWSDSYDSEMLTIKTPLADTYTQNYDDSGEVLYEDENVKIVSKGIAEDINFMGPVLVLYIENNMEKGITVQGRDTSVNGFMIDAILSSELMPGKKTFANMTLLASDLKDNQIETIETLETSFHIFNTDGWATIKDTDPITINFN